MSDRDLPRAALKVLKLWAEMRPIEKISSAIELINEGDAGLDYIEGELEIKTHWLARDSIEHDTDDLVRKIDSHLKEPGDGDPRKPSGNRHRKGQGADAVGAGEAAGGLFAKA